MIIQGLHGWKDLLLLHGKITYIHSFSFLKDLKPEGIL